MFKHPLYWLTLISLFGCGSADPNADDVNQPAESELVSNIGTPYNACQAGLANAGAQELCASCACGRCPTQAQACAGDAKCGAAATCMFILSLPSFAAGPTNNANNATKAMSGSVQQTPNTGGVVPEAGKATPGQSKFEAAAAGMRASEENAKRVQSMSKVAFLQIVDVGTGAEDKDKTAFDKAIFSASEGQVEGPVKTSLGYYVFEVTKETPKKTQSLAQTQQSIRQIVASEKQQKALAAFGKYYQERWRQKTECQKGYIVADCNNYKAPKQPAATTPAQPQPQPAPQGGN